MAALFRKKTPAPTPTPVETKPIQPVELKTILSWQAPVRPFKKRDKEFFTTVAAIAFLVCVILLFIKEWLGIAVVASLVFVGYVLATVEPEKTEHEITTRGVKTGEKLYKWEELSRFWFTDKWGQQILNIDTRLRFPSRLIMLLADQSQDKIKEILGKYLQLEEPEVTFMDRSAKWLSDKIPLEKK
ncbi:MAG TPA: hypothetical protein VJ242_03305 [Patescibacteria group bacterium]|nr:hypothetical protein [Patescibacteria group bacterium]